MRALLVYRMPETEGSTHHREAGAGPGVSLTSAFGRFYLLWVSICRTGQKAVKLSAG